MKEWLKDKDIENEYGETVTREEFWKMIAEKQKKFKLNHAKEMALSYPNEKDSFLVGEYSFSDCVFS